MQYEDFKKELIKQIELNAKYFKPGEIQVMHDLAETMAKEDFEDGENK